MKKLLITGASGFIGDHLISKLSQHYEVGCLLLPGEKNSRKSKVFRGDVTKPPTLEKACKWADIVVHGAGLTHTKYYKNYYRVNTYGTENILEFCKNIEHFIFLSSVAVMGPSKSANDILDETSTPNPQDHYGKSKLKAEELIKQSGINYTIFRLVPVYGSSSVEFIDLFKMAKNRLLPSIGFSDKYTNMIYVEDLAECVFQTLQNKKFNQTYILTDGNTYTTGQILAAIEKSYNHTCVKVKIPESMVKLFGFLFINYNNLTNKDHMLDEEKLPRLLETYWIFSSDKFRRDFPDMQFTDLVTGFARTKQGYLERNWL